MSTCQTCLFPNDGVDKQRGVVARSRVAQVRPSRTEGFHEAVPQATNQRMRFCSEGVSCMVSGVTFKDRFANALLIKQQWLSTCFECVVYCRAIQEQNLCIFVPGYFGKNAHLEILHMPPPIPPISMLLFNAHPAATRSRAKGPSGSHGPGGI